MNCKIIATAEFRKVMTLQNLFPPRRFKNDRLIVNGLTPYITHFYDTRQNSVKRPDAKN